MLRSSEKKRWLVFDVGNTLVCDTESSKKAIGDLMTRSGIDIQTKEYLENYQRITEAVFDYENVKPFATVENLHRKRLEQLYEIYHLDRDATKDVQYVMLVKGECELYPGVETAIKHLRDKWRLAILSNADDDDPAILYLADRFSFECIVTSESAQAYKPDPRIFRYFLEKSGADKKGIFYIGDHQRADILGGKNFGLRVIWMNHADKVLQENVPLPDYEVRNLEELLAVLANV